MASHLWFFSALAASVCWGLGYALTERILKSGIHPAFLLLAVHTLMLPVYLLVVVYLGQFRPSIEILMLNKKLLTLVFVCSFFLILGTFLILIGIVEKNATAASMIEIAYPFFTALFAYALFKDVQLNWGTVVAALLIFSGIGVMYVKG